MPEGPGGVRFLRRGCSPPDHLDGLGKEDVIFCPCGRIFRPQNFFVSFTFLPQKNETSMEWRPAGISISVSLSLSSVHRGGRVANCAILRPSEMENNTELGGTL